MRETHPFGNFIPKNARYLVLGSFATKPTESYDWFYSNGRNHFWPIISEVYGIQLEITSKKKKLFTQLKIAISDIILSCERDKNSNLDINLKNIEFNYVGLENLLSKNNIQKIFFTSRYVETLYRRKFKDLIQKYPEIELITLPSPSPRYATMTKSQKIEKYKVLLPKL